MKKQFKILTETKGSSLALCFYKAFNTKSTPLDWAIGLFSLGKYSHVELGFRNNDGSYDLFSVSSSRTSSFINKTHLDYQWEVIPLDNVHLDDIRNMRKYILRNMLGKKYSVIGALFSIFRLRHDLEDKYYCSEIVTKVLKEFKLYDGRQCFNTTPSYLYKYSIRNYKRS